MESTPKIGQDKYFLKILTFWSTFVQKSTFGNWTFAQFLISNEETGPKIGMYSKNWVGQVHFENFDFLVKVKSPLGQSIFFFFFFFFCFFFFKFFAAGSDRVRFPGRSGSNQGSGGWRHPWRHAQRARVSAWCVELVAGWGGVWNCADDAEARGGAWLIVCAWNFWVL